MRYTVFAPTNILFQKSTHHLFPSIDWERVENGEYAVVDPSNSSEILYLRGQDYLALLRTCLSTGTNLMVLAAAGTKQPSHTSPSHSSVPSTPPRCAHGIFGSRFLASKMYRHINRLIILTDSNIWTLLTQWASLLTHWSGRTFSSSIQTDIQSYIIFQTNILKTQGVLSLVKRWKVILFVINSYLSGNRLSSTHPLGINI
jgi:hypothetical protein